MNSNCNKSSVTTDKLKEWWNEVKTVDLTQTVEYTADIKNFGQMVNSKVTGFACTYNKCDSGGKLVCMYDSSRDDTTNKVLYDKGGTCTCQDCVKFLCQPDYKVSTVTEPQPLAIDGMTYDQEMLALRLTNYYRRLLATGWAEDSKGYAKWAAKMPPLAYEAPIAVHAKSEADDCDKTTYTPDAANSLNFFKGSYQDTIEKTIEEAIKSWWGKLKGVDVPDNGDYTGDMETNAQFFANMAYEGATKMGCAVADCKQKGFTAFICEYNSAPVVDDTLYTVGKTCSKCTTKKCEDAGGLCAP
ncbi:SCP-like protein [Ancylostoma ceylanicum]|uniref:SCP-like protein n=1 Tax=Ancylostoma ceylanicum TaxID=53326 RepID=A0A0D6LYY0_9BILA|nr:SCP-like protein [Ancylostoma ceylanicum]